MKYLITESQLDNIIFKYLDNQDFIKVKKGNEICFLNSSDDLWAVMKYMRGMLIISDTLTNEIKSFFSIDQDDAEILIRDWVSKKIGINIDIWDVKTLGGLFGDTYLSM
jgi:hypothetical protein